MKNLYVSVVVIALLSVSCSSSGVGTGDYHNFNDKSSNSVSNASLSSNAKINNKTQDEPISQEVQSRPKTETQFEKFNRLLLADSEKLQVIDNKVVTSSIEEVLKPQAITSISEITLEKLAEFGKPYFFKLRALYKGYDAEAKVARLLDLGKSESYREELRNRIINEAFGVDNSIYSEKLFGDVIVPTLPSEANSTATFYIVAAKFNQDRNGTYIDNWIRFVRDIEKPFFDPAKFIVANDMHYITTEDAHVPTQQDVMLNLYFRGTSGSVRSRAFDPITYSLVDLFDARVAMDNKKYNNELTLPTFREKYASEVIFRGQSGTTITVSTPDGVLKEDMNFHGRTTGISNGSKIRVFYTIAKDPYEIWEAQAIERL